jgi:hypothetical protein
MSDQNDKFKNSRRRQKDENAVHRQVKIAKTHNVPVDEPHKLAKHHALNCGDPKCSLCSNPRHSGFYKGKDRLTPQERRLFQDTDTPNDRHSNGLKPDI